MDFNLIVWVLRINMIVVTVHGGALLRLDFQSFTNPGGRDWDGDHCDLWGSSRCDHRFAFCADISNGDSNPSNCLYQSATTSHFQNKDDLQFGTDIGGVSNPWDIDFDSWPGSIKLKIHVEDDDSGYTSHDLVDKLVGIIRPTLYPSTSTAKWVSLTLTGTRPKDATSLELRYKVYCKNHYYGGDCATYCVAQDTATWGHYTCHADTGAKVCRYGWENPSDQCKVWADDCGQHKCANGATCRDGDQSYTCKCAPGYTGRFCVQNINNCKAGQCQNGGTCIDLVNGFKCNCRDGYFGLQCEQHVCDREDACRNGGTCLGNGHCVCASGYLGDKCTIAFCDVYKCHNGGTCTRAGCKCRAGYHGSQCGIHVCDFTRCQHGGTCVDGGCTCSVGYHGDLCEMETPKCTNRPCLNGGMCEEGLSGFTCYCGQGYTGNLCQNVPDTSTRADPETTTVPMYTLVKDDTTKTTRPASVPMRSRTAHTNAHTTGPQITPQAQFQQIKTKEKKIKFELWMSAVIVIGVLIFVAVPVSVVFIRRRVCNTLEIQNDPSDQIANPLYSVLPTRVSLGTTNQTALFNNRANERQQDAVRSTHILHSSHGPAGETRACGNRINQLSYESESDGSENVTIEDNIDGLVISGLPASPPPAANRPDTVHNEAIHTEAIRTEATRTEARHTEEATRTEATRTETTRTEATRTRPVATARPSATHTRAARPPDADGSVFLDLPDQCAYLPPLRLNGTVGQENIFFVSREVINIDNSMDGSNSIV